MRPSALDEIVGQQDCCRIFELKQLSKDDLITLIDRALTDNEKGLGNDKIIIPVKTACQKNCRIENTSSYQEPVMRKRLENF